MAPILHTKGQANSSLNSRKAAYKRCRQARSKQTRIERKRAEGDSSAQMYSSIDISFANAKWLLPPSLCTPTNCDAVLASAILASLEQEYPREVGRLRLEMGLVWEQGACMGDDTSFTFEVLSLWILDREQNTPFELDLNDPDLPEPFKALVNRLRASLATV